MPSIHWPVGCELESYTSPLDREFQHCFAECGFQQWVDFGTFFPSGNTLDLVFTSDSDRVGDIYPLPPLPGCHHSPIIGTIIFEFHCDMGEIRSMKKLAWSDFSRMSEDLFMVNWELLFDGMDVNECYEIFLDVIDECIAKYVPQRKPPSVNGKWLADPPRELLRERASLWRNYKQSRNLYGRNHQMVRQAWEMFSSVNFSYRHYARLKQCRYEAKLLGLLQEAPKVFHAYIRERKSSCPSVGPLKISDGNIIKDNRTMSELFREAFISVYNSSTPSSPHPYQQTEESMVNLDVIYDNVLKVLENLDGSSSTGIDAIHPMLLKSCGAMVALPLTIIFCKSLEEAELPRAWKLSRVIPIFKAGSKYIPLNYRPVSLTSACC